jgi:hypothetical protein
MYRYDALGNRVFKSSGEEAYFVRGKDGSVLAAYDQNGVLRKWNILASGQVIGYVVP